MEFYRREVSKWCFPHFLGFILDELLTPVWLEALCAGLGSLKSRIRASWSFYQCNFRPFPPTAGSQQLSQ